MIELKQSPVRFVSDGHKYFLGEKELSGITSTLIKKAYPNTYKKPDKYTDEEWETILDNAAAKGSNMHETIELYDELVGGGAGCKFFLDLLFFAVFI